MILNNVQQFHADDLRLTLDRLNGLGVGVKVDGGVIELYPIDVCVSNTDWVVSPKLNGEDISWRNAYPYINHSRWEDAHRQMLPFIRCEPDKKWWEFWK